MNVLFLFRPLMDLADDLPEGPQRSFVQGQAVGGLIGGGIALIYPSLLLFFIFRPNVTKAYCGHIEDGDGTSSDYLGGDGGASDAQDVKWE